MAKRRNVIVHIGTSADGYIARPDGDLEWLTSRPAPEGFYGMGAFMQSVDTKLLGRMTYEVSLHGAKFDSTSRTCLFPPGGTGPPARRGVRERSHRPIRGGFEQSGKDIWLMGGGELIASSWTSGDRPVRRQWFRVHRGWHSPHRATSPRGAPGLTVRRTLRGRAGTTALPRSEAILMTLHPTDHSASHAPSAL
jgi:hypothetical protein